MLEFLNDLRESNKDDEKVLKAINEIESELNNKKYGLVWEEHEEEVDRMLKDKIPVFSEVHDKEIKEVEDDGFNFLLEGDNLHSLKLLEKTHKGKVDVIYIDPPYNTKNKEFIYDDHKIGEDDTFRHSMWLSFMNERLQIARELLSSDGVIFISIDRYEESQLKLLCDEIFGENNFIAKFIWEKTQHFGRQKKNYYSNCEYVLCYAKKLFGLEGMKELLIEYQKTELEDAPLYNASNPENEIIFPKGSTKFNIKDGCYEKTSDKKYKLQNKVIVKNGVNENEFSLKFKSRWSPETVIKEFEDGTTYWVKSNKFAVRAIYSDKKSSNESPKQLLFTNANNEMVTKSKYGIKVGTTEEASAEFDDLGLEGFSYPKPLSLIEYLLSLIIDNNVIILDFFAGSGTTAQAVLELNKEDGGNRKFILCTNNENNICEDITYQRIKTVITGKRKDGSEYSEGIPANLKYYKTDFVSKDEEYLTDDLNEHIKEMIQLELGVDIDDVNYCLVLSDDDTDELEEKIDEMKDLKGIYVSKDVLLTSSQKSKFKDLEKYVIPDCYYDKELKESGE